MRKLRIIFSYFAIIALTLALVPLSPASAQAAECDEDFYMGNDILYYNPCEDFCTGSTGASTGKVTTLSGANNGEKIYNFWVAAGLTPSQSAGVTGSMKEEGGFSAFRQEGIFGPVNDGHRANWPNGGWGIAQFTWDPGQRGAIKEYLTKELGAELFNQYYSVEYGGPVFESDGYIPKGVPADVNDKFLLGELNYLLEHVQGLVPNNVRTGAYLKDFNKTIAPDVNLYEHLKSLQTPGEAAVAWTYLYEWPGDVKNTSMKRSESADALATLFSGSQTESVCGAIGEGGLNLEQAKAFMETYKQIDNGDPNGDARYLSGACQTLTDNCVTFVSYYVNKYTSAKFGINNGAMVVNSTLAVNPDMKSGTTPQPFSIFAVKRGVTMCDWDGDGTKEAKCGHTGIVLGVDTAKGVVIVGEAAYCNPAFTAAREYPLSEWSNGEYTYAYLQPYLKSEAKAGTQ